MRVLIADSNPDTAKSARLALRSESLVVEIATTPSEAIDRAIAVPYNAIVLDLDLADADGVELIKRFRRHRVQAPVLVLISDARPEARIEALRFGADDCLTKPALSAEIAARVHALARRSARKAGACLEVDDLVLHCEQRRAFRGGQALPLTEREFLALEHLVRAHGEPISAEELLRLLWHEDSAPRPNFIAVLLMRLRKKIDDGHEAKLIRTVRGVGYAVGLAEGSR